MHIKHMHEMIEKLAECTKSAIENDEVCVGQYPISDCTDMLKDLCEAEYYAHISKAMDEAKKEEEEQDKYMLKRIKEEFGDDEEGARRYYDSWRYDSGRFAPKGRGNYRPMSYGRSRRGYEEMFMPEMYDYDEMERMRDLDRDRGKMYFSAGTYASNYGGNSGNRSGNSEGSDGRRNYDGDGRRNNSGNGRDYREGRSGQRRRGYIESKELHSDNSPESKQHRMKELDAYMKDLSEDVTEMIGDASAEERALLKQKMQGLVSKL